MMNIIKGVENNIFYQNRNRREGLWGWNTAYINANCWSVVGTQSGFRIPGARNTVWGLVKQEAEGKQRQCVKRCRCQPEFRLYSEGCGCGRLQMSQRSERKLSSLGGYLGIGKKGQGETRMESRFLTWKTKQMITQSKHFLTLEVHNFFLPFLLVLYVINTLTHHTFFFRLQFPHLFCFQFFFLVSF